MTEALHVARSRRRGLPSEVRGQMVNVRVKGVNKRLCMCVCVCVSPVPDFWEPRQTGGLAFPVCVCVYRVGTGVVRGKEESILTSLKQVGV